MQLKGKTPSSILPPPLSLTFWNMMPIPPKTPELTTQQTRKRFALYNLVVSNIRIPKIDYVLALKTKI